jgi:hypothetical protein
LTGSVYKEFPTFEPPISQGLAEAIR